MKLIHQAAATSSFFMIVMAAYAASAIGAEPLTLVLHNHRFIPDRITAPAGQRFRIEVTNQDDTPEEFESSDLRIEKIIPPGGKITVTAGPLKPGIYKFGGEYNPDTATGTVVVVDAAAGQ